MGRVPAWGKPFRPCAVSGGLRRGACSRAGQILSLVRRVGRPSPRRAFSRGANPFARAPCREAFAEGRVLAWANPFARAPCREAFAEESLLAWGKSCPPPRGIGKPWRAIGSSPRGARRPAGGAGSACGLGRRSGPVSVSQKRSSSSRSASASSPPAKTRARAWSTSYCAYVQHRAARASSSSASARSAARRSCCDSSSRRSFI